MWQQSIDSNRAAHAAAVAYVRKTLGPESFDSETVHTMDYLEYAYLQTAQDRGAKEVVDELTSFRQSAAPNLPTAYAVAAIPEKLSKYHGMGGGFMPGQIIAEIASRYCANSTNTSACG